MYDVVVCGAGPAGTAAAIAAARAGARVLVVERYGFAGGMATSALVNPMFGWNYSNPATGASGSLTGGLFREMAQRLYEAGAFDSALTPGAFDEQQFKYLCDCLLRAAGTDILFHTWITGLDRQGERIVSIRTFSKDGAGRIEGKIFVDATGDGDIAAFAGCRFTFGRPADGLTQAMTTSFRMANVDKSAMIQTGNLIQARALVEPYFKQALAAGSLVFPHRDRVQFYDYPRSGVLHFNMTRIGGLSGLAAADLTQAEIEGRRQAFTLAQWMVDAVPYFQNSWLEKVACQVGIRETRHIAGRYTVTQDDIATGRKFPDAIMRSTYFIDIHSPHGPGFEHEEEKGKVKTDCRPPQGDYYEVPYRAILPVDAENLLIACRALSCSHEGAAAVRVMANMIAIGEAAGLAAARAARAGVSPHEIDGAAIRRALGYLDQPPDTSALWSTHRSHVA